MRSEAAVKSERGDEPESLAKGVTEDVLVWVALLILLALTMGAGFADWGPLSTALSFLISAAKTALIAYFYMHIKRERGMTRVFALAGITWLGILFALTLSDYLSRGWLPYPSRWPIFVKLRPALNEQYGPEERQPPRPGDFGVGR
jgi:cytochrome c oxidase subunit 4